MKHIIKGSLYNVLYSIIVPLIALIRAIRRREISSCSVIIAPPGGGNIGDSALVESAINNIKSSSIKLINSGNSYTLHNHKVVQIENRNLFYGSFSKFCYSLFRLSGTLIKSEEVLIIGADIMDGRYNESASMRRSFIAAVLARVSKVKILGFSLNRAPTRLALFWLKKAGENGVDVILRDPRSYERAAALNVKNIRLGADIVFLHPMFYQSEGQHACEDQIQRKVILNVSGLLLTAGSKSVTELSGLVNYLVEAGKEVHLLPHVIREGSNDLDALHEVGAKINPAFFKNEKVVLHKLLKTPREVKELCEGAEFVITGRMHLGVIALRCGVPAFIFESQDKVRGLLEMFEIDELLLDMNSEFVPIIKKYVSGDQNIRLRSKIKRNLSKVEQLARGNFL